MICHLQNDGTSELTIPIHELKVYVGAGATPGTVTCLAQVGDHGGTSAFAYSSSAKSFPVAAGDNVAVIWGSMALPRGSASAFAIAFNCKLPPGFRMGSIYWSASNLPS